MSQYFKPYLYYNGEPENPFKPSDDDPSFMFWSYEQGFDSLFRLGDFKLEDWEHIATDQAALAELKDVLAGEVDKEELFKLYMFHILMEHLPDKAQEPPSDRFLKLYSQHKA